MVGRSFEETTQLLVKALKAAEVMKSVLLQSRISSQNTTRTEILNTLAAMVTGLGSAGTSVHKEIYKATKPMLNDRVMHVRIAAAKVQCLHTIKHDITLPVPHCFGV